MTSSVMRHLKTAEWAAASVVDSPVQALVDLKIYLNLSLEAALAAEWAVAHEETVRRKEEICRNPLPFLSKRLHSVLKKKFQSPKMKNALPAMAAVRKKEQVRKPARPVTEQVKCAAYSVHHSVISRQLQAVPTVTEAVRLLKHLVKNAAAAA